MFIRTSGTGNLRFVPIRAYTPSTVPTLNTNPFIGSIDTISARRIEGGNVAAYGLFTGGGSNGIKVDLTSNVGVALPQGSATIIAQSPYERLVTDGNIVAENTATESLDANNKVVNGDFFDGSNNWSTTGVGWNFISGASGIAIFDPSGAVLPATLEQNINVLPGELYNITFTISSFVRGSIRVTLGGVNSSDITGPNGSRTLFIRTNTTGNLIFTPILVAPNLDVFNARIDNIIVRKVIGGNITPYGLLTGGGTRGINIDASGNVGLALSGTTANVNRPSPYDRLVADGNIVAQNPSIVGLNKVINGTFDGSNNWTFGNGWTYVSTIAVCDTSGVLLPGSLEQNIFVLPGELYQITFTISSYTRGTLLPSLGGVAGDTYIRGNGTYTILIKTNTSGNLMFTPISSFLGRIDNISARKVEGGNITAYGLFTGGGSNGVKVDSSGNVGIGTTAPSATLDISGNEKITYNNSTTYTTSGLSVSTNNGLWINNSFDDTSGNSFTSLYLQNRSSNVSMGSITLIGKHFASSLEIPGAMTFGLRPNSGGGTITERMRIRNDGFVGIGTSEPRARLDVNGNSIIGGNLDMSLNNITRVSTITSTNNITIDPSNTLIVAGDLDLSCNLIQDVSGIYFCDGTYIGQGSSFDISSNQVLVLSGKQDPSGNYNGASIITKDRLYQQLKSDASWNSVNGYYGMSKDAYPALSNPSAQKAVNNWNLINTIPNIWWSSIPWSGELGIFCSVGLNGTSVIVSRDGINWDSSGTPISSYHTLWSKERSIFCAVGAQGNRVQTSTNGLNWQEIPSIDPSALLIEWYQVAWSPQLELFCAVGVGAAGLKRVMTSINGLVWELQNTPNNNETLTSIGWSAELGMFCAGDSNRILYSFDGKLWNYGTGNIPGSWRQIVWSSSLGRFCSVSPISPSNICTSVDGINWSLSNNPLSMQWWGLTWSPQLNIFVATASATSGSNSKITYSYDGINWILVPNSAYNRTMRSITWSPELGIFCANGTGQGGVIISSLQGRPPTSYNVFDSSFNNIDSDGQWSFQAKSITSRQNITIDPSNTLIVAGNLDMSLNNITRVSTITNTGNITIDPSNTLIVAGNLEMSGNTIENVSFNYDASYSYPYLRYNSFTKTISYKELHYANLYNTLDIALPQNTIVDLSYNAIVENKGISYSGANITFTQTGKYKIGSSILASESGGSSAQVYFWFNLNGTSIPNSSSIIYTAGNNSTSLGYAEIIVDITDISQYVKIQAYSTSAGMTIDALNSPAANVPSSPSILTTVIQIV